MKYDETLKNIPDSPESPGRWEYDLEHFKAIIDSIEDGVMTIDKRWVVRSFNKAAERITGYSEEEAVGKICNDVCGCDIRSMEECPLVMTLKTQKPHTGFETRIKTKDGKTKVISLNTQILRNKAGKPIGGIEIFRDITPIRELEKKLQERYSFSNIIGRSKLMQEIYDLIDDIRDSNATVLIQGESGTGKELIANAIHYNSPRSDKPPIKVNCSALAEELLESELFGHVRGAFTGAIANKPGRFELADGGTLFLDEIGDISPRIQLKLLRVLQEKEFERVGGIKTIKVDVRIIAATNRDLKEAVLRGEFREDLFYRLNVVPIKLPPLRKRKEDIPLLVEHLVKKLNDSNSKEILEISDEVMDMFMGYDWPGNIRELENSIEYAFVKCKGDKITRSDLPPDIRDRGLDIGEVESESKSDLEGDEREELLSLLRRNGWNITKCSETLRVHRTTLWRKMKKYGIERP